MPEPDFLALCGRCGECMAACPTNTLQPLWLEAGFNGLFSPKITPEKGPCDPRCERCGYACPTGAILPLTGAERIWAKTGTAVLDKKTCIAWEGKKACMACDEACVYGAAKASLRPGHKWAVPEIAQDKCAGCGACEHACPVRPKRAIKVTAKGALRLAEGSHEKQGRAQGLRLSLTGKTGHGPRLEKEPPMPIGPAPGFDP
jgi:ferredoxin